MSVENRLLLGREWRLAFAATLDPDLPPPPRQQLVDGIGAPKGLVSGGARWTEERLAEDWRVGVRALGGDRPELDLAFAALRESLEAAAGPDPWLRETQPLVIRTGRKGRIRLGAFSWTTDGQAFLRDLLGQVPNSPRYLKTAPSWPANFEALEDVQELLGLSVPGAAQLYRQNRESTMRDPAFRHALLRSVSHSPVMSELLSGASLEGFPLAELFHPLVRAAPHWRQPRVDLDFVALLDLGVLGVVGIAMWMPGMPQLRSLRRPLAAHLRYLMDFHVAPWRRARDRRARQEAYLLYFRTRWVPERLRGRPESISALCDHWRKLWPDLYRHEPAEVTLRRLYRVNAALGASRVSQRS